MSYAFRITSGMTRSIAAVTAAAASPYGSLKSPSAAAAAEAGPVESQSRFI